MIDEKWLTKYGMVAEMDPNTGQPMWTDNDILNWANYQLAKKIMVLGDKVATVVFLENAGYPNVKSANNSHDNHAAVLSLCAMHGLQTPRVSVRGYFEPRVFIFDKIYRDGGLWWALYPILLLIMVVSCLTNGKSRPIWWRGTDWWVHMWRKIRGTTYLISTTDRTYKNIKCEEIKTWSAGRGMYQTRKYFKTDGKILALHRVNALINKGYNMGISKSILNWCLSISIGPNWNKDIWRIFYRQNDPIFKESST